MIANCETKSKLNWQLYVKSNRNLAIESIKDIISKNGGYIIYSNLFSDLALALTVEIEENRVEGFYNKLKKEYIISDCNFDQINTDSNKEYWILINISFGKGKGDVANKVPNVPG